MRQRTQSLPPSIRLVNRPNGNGVALYDAPVYLHTSTFHSPNLELSIRSPNVKTVNDPKFAEQPIPVFSGRDSIGGTVLTAIPTIISRDHQLTISLEGAFYWIGPQREEIQVPLLDTALPERIKHVFLASTIHITLSPDAAARSARISKNIQEGFRKTFFPKHRRRAASETDASRRPEDTKTSHSFSFPLPVINASEVPNTLSASHVCQGNVRGRWYAENAQIAYRLRVCVRPTSEGDKTTLEEQLEAPIIVESETEERVPDPPPPDSWKHSQLAMISVDPVDFISVLSLPQPAEYARTAIIPFYLFIRASASARRLVPRLIKEARIRVTLIRRLHLDSGLAVQAPAPRTRLPEDINPEPKQKGRINPLLRRVSTRTPKIFKWNKQSSTQDHTSPTDSTQATNSVTVIGSSTTASRPSSEDKPLPDLPVETEKSYEDVICSLVAEGFPKRVARKSKRASLQPEMIVNSDGVFKGELRLNNELLNTIDWPGVTVTYFIEAIVYYEESAVRTRELVRLVEPYRDWTP